MFYVSCYVSGINLKKNKPDNNEKKLNFLYQPAMLIKKINGNLIHII